MIGLLWISLLAAQPQIDSLVREISESGRVLEMVGTPSERIAPPPPIAPGQPPLLSFRYFDGRQRHRFGKLDLVMDDAGH